MKKWLMRQLGNLRAAAQSQEQSAPQISLHNSVTFTGEPWTVGADTTVTQVIVGANTKIGSGIKVLGTVIIGEDVTIMDGVTLNGTWFPIVIANGATIGERAELYGCIIGSGAWIGNFTNIQQYTYIKTGAHIGIAVHIGRDVRVGKDVFISDNCTISKEARIGKGAKIEDNIPSYYRVPAGSHVTFHSLA